MDFNPQGQVCHNEELYTNAYLDYNQVQNTGIVVQHVGRVFRPITLEQWSWPLDPGQILHLLFYLFYSVVVRFLCMFISFDYPCYYMCLCLWVYGNLPVCSLKLCDIVLSTNCHMCMLPDTFIHGPPGRGRATSNDFNSNVVCENANVFIKLRKINEWISVAAHSQ